MVTLARYVDAFVDRLVELGLRHVVFSPGSRSTPLALGFARRPEVKMLAQLDERSAGFLALGIAKGSRLPTALLCTSGTAAANYLPAIVEARYGRAPLIALTADRPHEARELGAPQTIDQIKLFGGHVKLFVEMPPPDGPDELLAFARTTAARAFAVAAGPPAGPVHLNFPFREPLVPAGDDIQAETSSRVLALPQGGIQGVSPGASRNAGTCGCPRFALRVPRPRYDPGELAALARELAALRRGVIVCGPQDDPRLAASAAALGRRLGYPVLADPLSGVRLGAHDRSSVVDAYDWLLRSEAFRGLAAPEAIVHIGAIPTSKPLAQWMAGQEGRLIVFDPSEWTDPTLRATDMIRGEPAAVCDALCEALGRDLAPDPAWLSLWVGTGRRVRALVESKLLGEPGLFEGRAAYELARLLPDGGCLFVGNSMPVRDVDAFVASGPKRLRVLANRGANGIDGVVSTACGVAEATGPTALLLGDLSFFHDLNGLLACKLHGIDLTIVLVHNDGGGIFSLLPQAGLRDFERLFGTPHGLDFAPAVAMHGGRFAPAADWDEFRERVGRALFRPGLDVIEVRSERDESARRRRRLWAEVAAQVDEFVRPRATARERGGEAFA